MKAWIALLALCASLAQAHEVRHRIEATRAVVVTLSYANGAPFAYEKYTLTPAGQTTPLQVGNTDAHGRIAFVPDAIPAWHLHATSADGHGVNQAITVPALEAQTTPPAETIPRGLLVSYGLALIFGFFGLFQLLAKKKT